MGRALSPWKVLTPASRGARRYMYRILLLWKVLTTELSGVRRYMGRALLKWKLPKKKRRDARCVTHTSDPASHTSDPASHRTWRSQLLGPPTKKKEETSMYDLATGCCTIGAGSLVRHSSSGPSRGTTYLPVCTTFTIGKQRVWKFYFKRGFARQTHTLKID